MITVMLCARCHYDLRGHAEDQRCPECGLSARVSRRLLGNAPRADGATGLFIGACFLAGFACWCMVLIASKMSSGLLLTAFVAAAAASLAAGVIGGRAPGLARAPLLRTIIAWPMAGWGIIEAQRIEEDGAFVLVWLAAAAVMAATTYIAGAIAMRRWLRRSARRGRRAATDATPVMDPPRPGGLI